MAGSGAPGAGIGRGLAKLLLLVLLLVGANVGAGYLAAILQMDIRPSNEPMVHRTIMAMAALYALLMAIPFVPGVELGLGLMAILGPPIAVLVYLCTVAGLSAAFAVGRLAGLDVLARLFRDLGLRRAAALMRSIDPLGPDERIALLVARAPHRLVPLLARHRHLALAVTLNVPGNIVLGGGGGIAMMAGVSGLYSVPGFLVTIALAVAPVPLAVLVLGGGIAAG